MSDGDIFYAFIWRQIKSVTSSDELFWHKEIIALHESAPFGGSRAV